MTLGNCFALSVGQGNECWQIFQTPKPQDSHVTLMCVHSVK